MSLELYLIPGRGIAKKYEDIYNKTYEMWKRTWQQTILNEWSDKETIIFSDDFTRQDEIMTLFYNGDCVGCVFFRYVDFDEYTHREDSYFKSWNELALKRLTKNGKKVFVASYFTLAEEFRGTKHGIPWKNVIATLTQKRFIHTDRDVGTGTMRRSKGMHKASYSVGTEMIQENVEFSICGVSEPVDLIASYRTEVDPNFIHPALADVVEQLWDSVVALCHPIFELEQAEVLKIPA